MELYNSFIYPDSFGCFQKRINKLYIIMKVVINSDYQQLCTFVEQIPDVFEAEGNMIYDGRNKLKTYSVEGFDVVVKKFKIPHFLNRIVYAFFRPTKARRSYEYAFRLLKEGILTPVPIAYIEEKKGGLLSDSYYISIFEKDFSDIRGEMMGTKNEYFLKELAFFIKRLHDKGILNKDLSPGNILSKKETNQILFSLVDINRIKFLNCLSKKERYRNFERISEKREIIDYLATEYAKACSLNVKEAVFEINKYIARYSKNYPTDATDIN